MTTTIILSVGALLSVAGWYFYWNAHAKKFETSGYMGPATSWFGEFGMLAFAYLLTFLTVGRVKVIGKKNAPKKGRVLFAANHQLPCDFAMVRRGSGRHFRMLTAADQLGGFFGLLCAAGGVISVNFKAKTDGALAEQACIKAVSAKYSRIPFGLAAVLWLFLIAGFGYFFTEGESYPAIACVIAALVLAGCPGSSPALGIFPQGSLLPDDPQFKELFRPGAVRIGRSAEAASSETVWITPMAIHYKRDPKGADWTHKYLSKMRSMFVGTRSPKTWNPIFKLNLDELSQERRAAVEAERKEALRAHRKSNVTNYGGVVVVGKPIDVSTLPADPIEAIGVIRNEIARLYEEAQKH